MMARPSRNSMASSPSTVKRSTSALCRTSPMGCRRSANWSKLRADGVWAGRTCTARDRTGLLPRNFFQASGNQTAEVDSRGSRHGDGYRQGQCRLSSIPNIYLPEVTPAGSRLTRQQLQGSTTCAAATVWMTGKMTPAVSHVGVRAASGGSSKTHRRQGVSPGKMVIVAPWLPTAAP